MCVSSKTATMRSWTLTMLLIGCGIGSATVRAQMPTRVYGAFDRDISSPPVITASNMRVDPKAVAVLTAYKDAIGGSDWRGMHATGSLVYANSQDSVSASLSILPNNRERLEVDHPDGSSVFLVNGNHGLISYAGARKRGIEPLSALTGLVPFGRPLDALTAASGYSLIDQGEAVVQGQTFHRVSIGIPLASKQPQLAGSPAQATLDCYFDTATHLLNKAAAYIAIPGTSRLALLRVTTFANYQRVGQLMFPMQISETVNGQAIWTLTLTSADPSNLPQPGDFSF